MFIRNISDLLDNNTVKTYSCGSPNLKDFLIKNGICPIYTYKHINTKRYVWIFIECDELSLLLKEWTKNKPKIKGGEKSE